MRDNYTLYTQERYEFVVEFLEREAGNEPFCITELFWLLPRFEFHLTTERTITSKVDSWVVREVVMDLLKAGILERTLNPPGTHGGRKYYRLKRGMQWPSAGQKPCG